MAAYKQNGEQDPAGAKLLVELADKNCPIECGIRIGKRHLRCSWLFADADAQSCEVQIPPDAKPGETIHVIVAVSDNGSRKAGGIRDIDVCC